ncbi:MULTISPECIES: hypothetical protein [Pseudoalteromonas]|uniref:hypothetical protein n=1 Tax=Pseudoalteromonas TaxID=53246 RepID=UPI001601234E|nr:MULTISPECIES: hypothetical protein [Pseudoalteromonas]MBB1333145.1 hypothetical protein [Pseudoalteromonas sp. SR41-6]MBB1458016.1 hypothetical protein [Pseudoalteromonas sp. SG41-8]
MFRSLRKGSRPVYFQQENTSVKIRAKCFESEINGSTAILRLTLKPVNANQSQDEKLLHKEAIIFASLADETIIEGFLAHKKISPNKILEYKLEILSREKKLNLDVIPKIEILSSVRYLYLNVKNG